MKYLKVKKFMKETGCDKKTAYSYLRENQWDYDEAIQMYYIPIAKAFDAIDETINNIADNFKDAFNAFGEAVANFGLPLKEER